MVNTYNLDNPMAPPWFMYPHISRFSIGWRMGYGENYIYDFNNWYSALSDLEKKKYQKMFPTPKGWLGWYEDKTKDIFEERSLLWNKDGRTKYTLDNVKHDFKNEKNMEFLFFWGHQPSKDGSITKSCLSQWWKAEFTVDTYRYCCMEQYMMAEKARLFNDNEILEQIINNKNPKEIKDLGRKVSHFNEEIWINKRYLIVLNGSLAKFLQNQNLKDFLQKTENKVLVETSPYDKNWGIGMSANDQKVKNPFEWKGQNLLGFALMEVRDEINRISKNYRLLNLQELHEQYD